MENCCGDAFSYAHMILLIEVFLVQADVEVTFSFSSLDKAEPFDPSWVDAQAVCGKLGSKAQGGVGPFGLLTLASQNLEEFTPVFFRIFKAHHNHVVLLCSDARRFNTISSSSTVTKTNKSLYHLVNLLYSLSFGVALL